MSEREEVEAFEGKWYAHAPMRNVLVAGVIAVAAYGLVHGVGLPAVVEIALYVLAIFLGGEHWMREGLEELIKEKRIGIEILMMAATIGSAFLGMWEEAAALVVIYGAAEGLEEYTFARTRASIRALLDLAPKEALVRRDGKEVVIPAQELHVGDIFIVKPGETLATDGVIVRGSSSINEATVTGESLPVEKREGMKVFAATLNQAGSLEVRATATFEDNTLSKIVHLVEEAQEQKGRAQLFIEKFGRIYSPIVLLTAILMLWVGGANSGWAKRAVVLLVAAAPCALVMSTPVAVAAGIGRAGKNGVLVKGGTHLEALGKIRAVAFDKTGTLTPGKPAVTDVLPLKGGADDVLRLAFSVEKFSEHPLAQAVVAKAMERWLEPMAVENFEAIVGAGARATISGRTYFVGKPDLFREFGVSLPDLPDLRRFREEGKTIVCLGTRDGVEGFFALRDEIRPGAPDVIRRLRRLGVTSVMLTGDNNATAQAIGREVGIQDIRADLKPEDKITAVKELSNQYGAVAMVGDGVNDAPALAQAEVGIAMGTAGSDAAIEAADVALMADDLAKVPYALELGRRARRISRQNIVFSLLLLAVLVPLALTGVMSVAVAVVVHEGSELLAVANGLRMGGKN